MDKGACNSIYYQYYGRNSNIAFICIYLVTSSLRTMKVKSLIGVNTGDSHDTNKTIELASHAGLIAVTKSYCDYSTVYFGVYSTLPGDGR